MSAVVCSGFRCSDELFFVTDRIRISCYVVGLRTTAYRIGREQPVQRLMASRNLVQPRNELLAYPRFKHTSVGRSRGWIGGDFGPHGAHGLDEGLGRLNRVAGLSHCLCYAQLVADIGLYALALDFPLRREPLLHGLFRASLPAR